MIKNVDDFKNKADYWLNEALASCCTCQNEEKEIIEVQRVISLLTCDIVYETDDERSFMYEAEFSEIINILSHGGKIKKLSEVDFDE